jgi:DNA end-binding protein Ku
LAARPSWQGALRFNLIYVPVKTYSANVSGRGKIGFHLIHRKCNSRIRYKKVCPVHGEVGNDEIASAYEYAKGQYVIVEPEELEKLHPENEKSITIDTFVRRQAIDPVYFAGRTYYLVPDGRPAQKPYAVLQEAMAREQCYGIARVIFSGRQQLVAVRPADKLLAMSFLNYHEQIKKPSSLGDDVSHGVVSAAERKLAQSLIEASTSEDFDMASYKDTYTSDLMKLIEAKAKGQKIVAPPAHEEPAVINLMDALRKSLRRARNPASPKYTPARKAARHHGKKQTG